jgi:Cd2+/Zn2+-exporting ATPase
MGAAGSDVALETADVALMHDDLSRIPQAVALARFARRIIAQNLIIALGVICVLAPLAALGMASIGVAVLFHEGSTVVVVLNGLRLLGFRPRPAPGAGRMRASGGAAPRRAQAPQGALSEA